MIASPSPLAPPAAPAAPAAAAAPDSAAAAAAPWADDDARWEAVLRREAAADGAFCYAVHSTGIYCRPTCPARRPRRDRVSFFATPEAAAAAGFRACRRCHPDEVAEWQRVVARVQHLLETEEPAPTLAALGAAVGLSPSHLQRVFKRATGLSPRRYAAARRAERLRGALRDGASVTTALYAAGYGSPRALYAAVPEGLGMPPRAYRRGGAGERIAYDVTETPLGPVLIAATERGICALRFEGPAPDPSAPPGGAWWTVCAASSPGRRCGATRRRSGPTPPPCASTWPGAAGSSTCRSTSRRPRSSSASGRRCAGFRTARPAPTGRWRR